MCYLSVSNNSNSSQSTGQTSSGGRSPSSQPGNGGNWPSTTGRPSGNGRGNGAHKGK